VSHLCHIYIYCWWYEVWRFCALTKAIIEPVSPKVEETWCPAFRTRSRSTLSWPTRLRYFSPLWHHLSEEEREVQCVLHAQRGKAALVSFLLSMCSCHANGMAVAVRFCWLMADTLSPSVLPEFECTFSTLVRYLVPLVYIQDHVWRDCSPRRLTKAATGPPAKRCLF